MEQHSRDCSVLSKKLIELRSLRDGLTDYATASYDSAYNDFEKLDNSSLLYFYLTGAALYRMSVQQKDLHGQKSMNHRESAGERMMSAYEKARSQIGLNITQYGHLKLKCNALGFQNRDEEWEECLMEMLERRRRWHYIFKSSYSQPQARR